MIIGIGTDMVAIARIEAAHRRFGARFLARIFTEDEITDAVRRGNRPGGLAMRFAAKEAAWKALPGARGQGAGWHDFIITTAEDTADARAPRLRLCGRAKEIHEAASGGGKPRTHLALSDDGGFALAFVVLSA